MADISLGQIMVWCSGSALIPMEWRICDGTNGTPDLRGLFIYGKNTDADTPITAGSASHGHTVPSAGVASSGGTHGHSSLSGTSSGAATSRAYTPTGDVIYGVSRGGHSHSFSITIADATNSHNHTVTLQTAVSLPPYIYGYYIMRMV